MRLDARDIILLVIIAVFLGVLVWTGLRMGACVQALNIVEEAGGVGYVCEMCDVLENSGFIREE